MSIRFLWHAWRFYAGYPVRKRIGMYLYGLHYVWQRRHEHDGCPVCAAESEGER